MRKQFHIIEVAYIVIATIIISHYYGYSLNPIFVVAEANKDVLSYTLLGGGFVILGGFALYLSKDWLNEKIHRLHLKNRRYWRGQRKLWRKTQ